MVSTLIFSTGLFSVWIGIFTLICRICPSDLWPGVTVDVLTREALPFPGGSVTV